MGDYMTDKILVNTLTEKLNELSPEVIDVICCGKTTIRDYINTLQKHLRYEYTTKTATMDIDAECTAKYADTVFGAVNLLCSLCDAITKPINFKLILKDGSIVEDGVKVEYFNAVIEEAATVVKRLFLEEEYDRVQDVSLIVQALPVDIEGRELLIRICNSTPNALIAMLELNF